MIVQPHQNFNGQEYRAFGHQQIDVHCSFLGIKLSAKLYNMYVLYSHADGSVYLCVIFFKETRGGGCGGFG